jgi:hypothetical protein
MSLVSFDDEAKQLAQTRLSKMVVPDIGSVWEHYNGGFYVVVAVSLREDSLEPMVTYRSNKYGTYWTRTLENFMGDWESSPGVRSSRFFRQLD